MSEKKEEYQYLECIEDILKHGQETQDRTGTGTYSVFGKHMTFSLRNNTLPLLTTKYVDFDKIFSELMWFFSGSTDAKELNKQGNPIWNKNTSRAELDRLGLTDYEEG